MLRFLRQKKLQKRIFYCLAAIIIPAFVIWGSASVTDKNKATGLAGVLFGKKVTLDQFRDAVSGWRLTMKLQYGEKANEIERSFFDPVEAGWDRLTLLAEAKKRRIKVQDSDVVSMITNLPFLQRDGRFDPQTYKLFLQYSIGSAPHVFEERLRQNIAMAKLFEEATRNVSISDDEVRKEYEKQNIQTRVQYVFFSAAGYKDKVSAGDDEIKAYFETNRETFKVPPQINAAYAAIEFKSDTPEEQKGQARQDLQKFYASAKSKSMEAASKDTKLEIKETGLFAFEDPVPTLGWVPQLSTLLFDLPAGSLSSIVELDRGIYLFQIKEKKESYLPDFPEAKEKVKEKFVNEHSRRMAKENAQRFLENLTTKSMGLEEAARKEGLEVKETPLFAREGYIPELGMAQSLKSAAFTLAKGETHREPIELEQGFACIQSIETIPVDEEKFAKEKEDFSQRLLEEKRNKAFNEFFSEVKKRAGLSNLVSASAL